MVAIRVAELKPPFTEQALRKHREKIEALDKCLKRLQAMEPELQKKLSACEKALDEQKKRAGDAGRKELFLKHFFSGVEDALINRQKSVAREVDLEAAPGLAESIREISGKISSGQKPQELLEALSGRLGLGLKPDERKWFVDAFNNFHKIGEGKPEGEALKEKLHYVLDHYEPLYNLRANLERTDDRVRKLRINLAKLLDNVERVRTRLQAALAQEAEAKKFFATQLIRALKEAAKKAKEENAPEAEVLKEAIKSVEETPENVVFQFTAKRKLTGRALEAALKNLEKAREALKAKYQKPLIDEYKRLLEQYEEARARVKHAPLWMKVVGAGLSLAFLSTCLVGVPKYFKLARKHGELVAAHEATGKRLEYVTASLSNAEEKVGLLEGERSRLLDAKNRLLEDVAVMRAELDRRRNSVSETMAALEDLQKRIDATPEAVERKRLEEEFEAGKRELEKERLKAEGLEKRLAESQGRVKELGGIVSEIQKKVEEQEKVIRGHEKTVEEGEKAQAKLREEAEKLRKEVEGQRKRAEELVRANEIKWAESVLELVKKKDPRYVEVIEKYLPTIRKYPESKTAKALLARIKEIESMLR